MAAVQLAATQLIDGVPTKQVIDELQRTYKTLSSLSSAMTHVRHAVAARGHTSPASFTLSRDATLSLKRKHDEALVKKNEHVIVVPDFQLLLASATDALRTATPAMSYSKLILPLLLVSGRRLTEICSPRSVFTPMPNEHSVCFTGALKKRRTDHTMTVPLLVPFAVFATGLLALRQKQGPGVAALTNKEISNRYQGTVQRDLALRNALPGAPEGIHIHDLRSAYLASIYEMYDCPYTLARTGMLVLGHTTLAEHLSYNNVRLENVGALKGSLGALDVDPVACIV